MTREQTKVYTGSNKPINFYGLAYAFSSEEQEQLVKLRAQLVELFGDNILLPPITSIHMTVQALTNVEFDYDMFATVDTYYNDNKDSYEEVLRTIKKSIKQFEVYFDSIKSSPEAIYLFGRDNGSMANIRKSLLSVPVNNIRRTDFNFIHSTQARYGIEMELTDVEAKLATVDSTLVIKVDRLVLTNARNAFTGNWNIISEVELG